MKKTMRLLISLVTVFALLCQPVVFGEKTDSEVKTEYALPSSGVTAEADGNFDDRQSGGANKYTLPGNSDASIDENSSDDSTVNDDKIADGNETVNDENNDDEQASDIAPIQSAGDVEKNDAISIGLTMIPRTQVTDSVAVFELYSADGSVKLGEAEEWIGGITERLDIKFGVPSAQAGDSFRLRLKGGLTYVKYYDRTYGAGEDVELTVYGYKNEEEEPVTVKSFELDACPLYEHAIIVYVEGKQLSLYPRARLVGDTAMIPVRAVAEALGIEVRYDETYNSIVCEVGDDQVIFNVGTAYATIFGEDTYIPVGCMEIDDTVFVPVRTLAEAFRSELEALDFGDHIDVCLGESMVVHEFRQRTPVNRWGISSRTNYLVWVSKSEYKVRVYTGKQYNWKLAATFPCAIGAPGTPTITGSFEYQYKASSWDYGTYYVGPCLVFHGGYALHSTLLRYSGAPYDNRVGVMISHGCVRMHKSDIDWLAARLPLKSRIYVTE